jgi:hypothetical protein
MEGSRGAFRRRVTIVNDRAHLKPPGEEPAVRSSGGDPIIVVDWGARRRAGKLGAVREARFAASADKSGEPEHARVEDGRSTQQRPVMTDVGRPSPEPLGQVAEDSRSPGGRIKRPAKEHERPLAEMLSISAWRSFVPETIALLAVISLVRAAVLSGPAVPSSMPHPYWIPVLLMSSQYGLMGGLFATLLAIASYFLSGLPVQFATQDFYAYAGVVAGQPCAWFGTALILGGLRTLHIHHQAELQGRFDQTQRAADDLADGLEGAVGEIERLERRIALDTTTLTSFTHSVAKLELSDRASLLASITDVIHHSVGATSFAIYLKGERELEPVLGVQNGSSLPPTAISPLAPSLLAEIESRIGAAGAVPALDGDCVAHMPQWSPIRLPGSAELIGFVICDCLQPSQDPAVAARRLDDVCRLLGVLLSAQPKGVSGVHQDG